METSPWRQRKSSSANMDSATEVPYGSSRRIKGKARVVLPGSEVKPERARKSLNEKLSTVVLESRTKERRLVSVCGEKGEEEMYRKDEDLGGELPCCHDASDELLKQLESLLKDRGRPVSYADNDEMIERKQPENDLIELKRRLENLATENRRLRNSLVVKEKLVESLHDRKSQLESEFDALMGRLDSTEKENAFLRYEYRLLEKDLEVRTEEIEYSRRSVDLVHKQQLKNVNKIVELEAECQRLRLLIRKKFPGATILLQPKLRSEAEERKMEMRRRNANTQNEFHNRKLHHDLLMDEIGNIREENKNLKEMILKKNKEIKDLEKNSSSLTAHELSPVANFDTGGNDDGISSSGSLSKALVSEPRDRNHENLRGRRVARDSEMSLYMEDFAEMEKYAVVSTDKNPRYDEDIQPFDWIQAVLSAISKQQRISKRTVKELLQDIQIASGCMDAPKDFKKLAAESAPLCIGWKSPSMSPESGSMTKEEIKKHLGLGVQITTADEESLDGQKQDPRGDNKNLKDEIKKIDSESKELRLKLEEKIRILEIEMERLKESKGMLEEQMETKKSINEDLDTQLSLTRAKLNETQQRLSSLEVELDLRQSFCEELEGVCLELQYSMEEHRKNSQNDLDMTMASMKLAECQETILNLRKQLKALALSSETRNITKFSSKGSSLRDQMLLEDKTEKPQNNNNNTSPHDDVKNCNGNALIVYTPRVYSITKEEEKRDGLATMAIVQSHKKQGFGFLKKILFRRRRRGTDKKCLALTM